MFDKSHFISSIIVGQGVKVMFYNVRHAETFPVHTENNTLKRMFMHNNNNNNNNAFSRNVYNIVNSSVSIFSITLFNAVSFCVVMSFCDFVYYKILHKLKC